MEIPSSWQDTSPAVPRLQSATAAALDAAPEFSSPGSAFPGRLPGESGVGPQTSHSRSVAENQVRCLLDKLTMEAQKTQLPHGFISHCPRLPPLCFRLFPSSCFLSLVSAPTDQWTRLAVKRHRWPVCWANPKGLKKS